MVVLHCWLVVVFFGGCVSSSKGEDSNEILRRLDATEGLVKSLSHRVDLLEAREKIHLERIADLESNDKKHLETIEELKLQLQEHHQAVKTASDMGTTDANEKINDETSRIQKKHRIERTIVADGESAVLRTRQINVQSPVAFLALRRYNLTGLSFNEILIFDNDVLNAGNGYDAAMGIFTAPVEGIYVFSVTLMSFDNKFVSYSFYHNNIKLNNMYVNDDDHESTGSTLSLHLQKGDVVSVRNNYSNGVIYGGYHSSFTGFLLFSYGTV